MGRSRRRIKSQKCYEVCFRARQGLPLVAYQVINLIIGSVIARAQRDNKVTLCHDIWNGSHAHLFLIAHDAEMFTCFLSEVQKQITEKIKRLLGFEHLNIWEGNTTIAEILDLEEGINRIAYIYANPGQDNLVDSIEKFPGFSSWHDFSGIGDDLNIEKSKSYPWIRQPTVPRLNHPILSSQEDCGLVKFLRKQNKISHALTRKPNLWIKCFNVTSNKRIGEINQEIHKRLRVREEAARAKRKAEGKAVIGVAKLTSQEIMKRHKPKKRERKIFCLSSINELRINFIFEFKSFCKKCRLCYQRWKQGDYSVEWPPGAFRPPLRPAYNILPAPSPEHLSSL